MGKFYPMLRSINSTGIRKVEYLSAFAERFRSVAKVLRNRNRVALVAILATFFTDIFKSVPGFRFGWRKHPLYNVSSS